MVDPAIAAHYGMAERKADPTWHEGEDLVVMPLAQVESADQPTKHPTGKMTSVGIGGSFSGALIVWLKARFDLDVTAEDVAVILPIITFAAGYFTKEILKK